jgi:hypothetical protein
MKLYKYKSLGNLWHVLDMVVNHRLYCAHWRELNDPLEGRYEIYLGKKDDEIEGVMDSRIGRARDKYRIACLSADPENFLLWSHYADGHKGIVVEIDIPDGHPDLTAVVYTPFSSVFSEKTDTKEDMRHLFSGKALPWSYEQEYRVITEAKYFELPRPASRLLLGAMVSKEQVRILETTLSRFIDIVPMNLDEVQGTLHVVESNSAAQPRKDTTEAIS